LKRIEDEAKDHAIALEYDGGGNIKKVIDSAGRVFEFTVNEEGLIKRITRAGKVLVAYEYDDGKNLTGIIDIHGNRSEISYEGHLMVKRVTKNGDAFNWEYDGEDTDARCIRTWGDGGLLEGRFDYKHDHTVHTDSFGNETVFHFDENMRLVKTVAGGKAETAYEYDEHDELVSLTNPDGEKTTYEYNEFGLVTLVALPSGGTQSMEYDSKGRLVKTVTPLSAETVLEYDEAGRVSGQTGPDGTRSIFEYGAGGMMSAITEGEGDKARRTEFEYDERSNLTRIKYPDGAMESWEYDGEGNLIKEVNPLGAAWSAAYDRGNRPVAMTAPDGNVTRLAYNAYDDVIQVKDGERKISFTYTPLGSVTSRTEETITSGRVEKMSYDSEGRLIGVENGIGEKYAFKYDAPGNVKEEIGYDGVQKVYTYSRGGKPTGVKRGASAGWVRMEYDAGGFPSKITYPNGDEELFTHGKAGELLAAENKNAKLTFEYDVMGNLIKETQNGHEVESGYSAGRDGRVSLRTSLGLRVDMNRDEYGRAEEIVAGYRDSTEWKCNLAYNAAGQVIKRVLNGNVRDIWEYDAVGRPIKHGVTVGGRESGRHRYKWEAGDKLKSLIDEIGKTGSEFLYDGFGIQEIRRGRQARNFKDEAVRIRRMRRSDRKGRGRR
jgi:YD repeat-containing protein